MHKVVPPSTSLHKGLRSMIAETYSPSDAEIVYNRLVAEKSSHVVQFIGIQ